MRLVISRDTFIIDSIPRGIDLADLRAFCGVSWDGRRRRLVAPLADAEMLRGDLERRGVCLSDREVRAAVASAFEHDPLEGPERIGWYGDARAIPELSRLLDAYAPGECVATDFLAVLGLMATIEALGGEPTEAQRGKVAEYERLQREAWPDGGDFVRARLAELMPAAAAPILAQPARMEERARPARRAQRPGRNEPCHCGSGRKYKLCHLALDEELVSPPSEPTRH